MNSMTAAFQARVAGRWCAPGLDSQIVDWTLPALAFMGIVEALVEPDPDHDPTVALAEYFGRASARSARSSSTGS
jgi:hypothetical protein